MTYTKKSGEAGAGNSGSPLFLVLKNKTVVLGGLCEGGRPDIIAFVPARYIVDDFDKKK